MPRIPQKELEELKRSVSLTALAESQGHKLHRQGRDVVLLCPFHDEKTPSLVISPDKNLFHCFGCGVAGSVVDWMMKTENFSLPKAVLRLRAFAGSCSSSAAAVLSSPPVRQTLTDLDDDGQALLHQVPPFFLRRRSARRSPTWMMTARRCCIRWRTGITVISFTRRKRWPGWKNAACHIQNW